MRLTVNAREYLVAPGILLVEGVLNNAYVPGEAIEADAWNGIPVCINHPRNAQGEALSARDPAVLAQYGIGYLYRAALSTGQRQGQSVRSLAAELWLDVTQVRVLGGEAAQAMAMLEAQTPLEVSTGFYATGIPQVGSFYGTPYTEVLVDLAPDHLALLPNDTGACSWTNGGCGAPRLHVACAGCDARQPCAACAAERTPMPDVAPPSRWKAFIALLRQFVQQEEPEMPPAVSHPIPAKPKQVETHTPQTPAPELVTEQTDSDVRESLYGALAREMEMDFTPVYIDSIDTANMAFVYRQGERLLLRRWTVDAAGILTLDANTEDVQRNTTFATVPGTQGPADDDPEDSNQDLPVAFQVQGQCPNCLTPLTHDATGMLAACAVCSLPAGQPLSPSTQERHAMSQPVVSPVAIKARVNNLIANKQYGWAERDRSMLEAMPEATLIRLETQPIIVPPPEPPPAPRQAQTPEEAISDMSPHLQDMFRGMLQDYQGRRQAALGMLIANKSCPFDQDTLQTMNLETLEKLVAMGAGVEYSGKGLPAERVVPEQLEQPPAPPNTMERVIERQKAMGLR